MCSLQHTQGGLKTTYMLDWTKKRTKEVTDPQFKKGQLTEEFIEDMLLGKQRLEKSEDTRDDPSKGFRSLQAQRTGNARDEEQLNGKNRLRVGSERGHLDERKIADWFASYLCIPGMNSTEQAHISFMKSEEY